MTTDDQTTKTSTGIEVRTSTNVNDCKSVNNVVCAYRNCTLKSSVRLYFHLGFSALFCKNCAKKFTDSSLAKDYGNLGINETNSQNHMASVIRNFGNAK